MINIKKACLLATLGGALVLPASVMAHEMASTNDVVEDMAGVTVNSTNGNCVITKWDGDNAKCNSIRLSREQRTVYFDFNKSTLNASEKAKLDHIAKLVGGSTDVRNVDIVGYADEIGNASYNKTLSTRRANTVRSYLAAKGLKTRKTHVQGMGENSSVTDCGADMPRAEKIACLAADRRVEVMLNFVK